VSERRWVYDRPVRRDGLFVASLICSAIAAVAAAVTRADPSPLVVLYDVVAGAAAGFFIAGVVGGSVRNFVRGYRDGGRP
jgi:hypothetical protein